MWNNVFDIAPALIPDKIVRTVLVYLAIAVLLRLAGKRDLAQLNSFDLVVMLLLSNVVQNAIIGPETSLTGGLLGAVVLLAVNAGVVRLARRSNWFNSLFEGTETILARDGEWDEAELDRLGLREADAESAVRRQNATDVHDTDKVTLAPGGALVVEMRPDAQTATVADVRRIEAKLDRLLAAL